MATEDSYAPRHGRHSAAGRQAGTGRHAAAGRHAAPRVKEPVEEVATEQVAAIDITPEPPQISEPPRPLEPLSADIPMATVPIVDGDQETSMSDAPRPIGVDPEETGSFSRINASEGAVLATRANASDTASFMVQTVRPVEAVRMSSAGRPQVEHREVEMQSNKRVYLILGIGALAVMALVITLLVRAARSVEDTGEPPVYEQVQATGDEGIEYRDVTYFITEQAAGKYALASTSDGFEGTAVLYELEGTPVTLILYNTVFVIPENLPDDTWDLIAHPLGGGSVTQQVTDSDGKPIVGQGQISEAVLSGDEILITTASGEKYSVSLV